MADNDDRQYREVGHVILRYYSDYLHTLLKHYMVLFGIHTCSLPIGYRLLVNTNYPLEFCCHKLTEFSKQNEQLLQLP